MNSYEELLDCLERGSINRSTGSTLMNETSSRSHAIFTIFLEMHKRDDPLQKDKVLMEAESDLMARDTSATLQDEPDFMTAKFHFVDLAGSERLKKTGASGWVMKEGININRGLFALGNVIFTLSDVKGRELHVPYRDSKLTRILQDSLGGNACTYMIACISPAESNFEESLSTLKYASRARNIKNKPIVNRDPQSAFISQLKQQIHELQAELLQWKKAADLSQETPINPSTAQGKHALAQKIKGQEEADNEIIKNLKQKLLHSEKENSRLRTELQAIKKTLSEIEIKLYSVQRERDLLKLLNEKYTRKLIENGLESPSDENLREIDRASLVDQYSATIERLQGEVKEKEKMNKDLQSEVESLLRKADRDNKLLLAKTRVVMKLQRQLKKEELFKRMAQEINNSSTEASYSMSSRRNSEVGNTAEVEDFLSELKNEDDESLEKEFEANEQLHKEEMNVVAGSILDKERILEKAMQEQLSLEQSLVDEMKNEYHTKIHRLEAEIAALEKQRDEALNNEKDSSLEAEKSRLLSEFKQKIADLQSKLKEDTKKERDQANLRLLVQNQQAKLEQLNEEIKTMKSQKVEMQKKILEESKKFEKWRISQQRELTAVKKRSYEKDSEIEKLKTESDKKDELLQKRMGEILANFMSADMIRHLQSDSGNEKLTKSKCVKSKSSISLDPALFEPIASSISEEDAQSLLDYCLLEILENIELSFFISKEEEALASSQAELEKQKEKYAHTTLQKEKLELQRESGEDSDADADIVERIEEYDLKLNDIESRIETQEEKIVFQRNKIQDLSRRLKEKPCIDLDTILFKNEKLKSNVASYQLLLRILLGKFISTNIVQIRMSDQLRREVVEVGELKNRLGEAEHERRLRELQYELKLTQLREEYEESQSFWVNQREALQLPEIKQSGNSDDNGSPNLVRQKESVGDGVTTIEMVQTKENKICKSALSLNKLAVANLDTGSQEKRFVDTETKKREKRFTNLLLCVCFPVSILVALFVYFLCLFSDNSLIK